MAQNSRFGRSFEIDLIASKKGVIVFVEVKTRKSLRYGYPEEAITYKKKKNLVLASQIYLGKAAEQVQVRIDVITITVSCGKAKLRHFIGV